MTVLAADVGGTNTRLALVGPEAGRPEAARYENRGFSSFYEVLARYCAEHPLPPLGGCCVAIAGPVTSDRARLTNLDWSIDAASIASALPVALPGPVVLVNDLFALGHSLGGLRPDQLLQIRAPDHGGAPNDQALVVGMGTGFNICLVRTGRAGALVSGAELGHASLPTSVGAALSAAIGGAADRFSRIEDLFSGRGLARLYHVFSDGALLGGAQILAAYGAGRRGPAAQSVELAARLLGIMAQELVFQYLPLAGIHFAGGAARGILGSQARAVFLRAFDTPVPFGDLIGQVPLRLITDDTAALSGAARHAVAAGLVQTA